MIFEQVQPVRSGFEKISESGTLFEKAQAVLSSVLRWVNEDSEARQAIWELQQLDDRALNDIGLHRSEIEAHVRGLRK